MRWISFRFQYFSTAQKIKFPIKDFFSKCDQIHSFLRMWRHLPKKSLTENFISCAVFHHIIQSILTQCSPHANAPLTKLENQNVSGVLRGIELDYPLNQLIITVTHQQNPIFCINMISVYLQCFTSITTFGIFNCSNYWGIYWNHHVCVSSAFFYIFYLLP